VTGQFSPIGVTDVAEHYCTVKFNFRVRQSKLASQLEL